MSWEQGELSKTVEIKDEENRQLAELVHEMERRMKKAHSQSKSTHCTRAKTKRTKGNSTECARTLLSSKTTTSTICSPKRSDL
jgi:2'-5' RNA ligase